MKQFNHYGADMEGGATKFGYDLARRLRDRAKNIKGF